MLPAPPRLKTTIIQLNKDIDPEDHNYEVLSNDYNQCSSTYGIAEDPPKKKRRRSSSFADKDELARRKAETKQLHSMIEKRRRVKINREFEALQYLIPACRNMEGNHGKKIGIRNVSNKSEGMYKLTILKTSVEYILYLHHIIQKQHALVKSGNPEYDFDISFSEVPLDVNQYRNIDQEFTFGDAISEESESQSPVHDQLLTPVVTPVISCVKKGERKEKERNTDIKEMGKATDEENKEMRKETDEGNKELEGKQPSRQDDETQDFAKDRDTDKEKSFSSDQKDFSSFSNTFRFQSNRHGLLSTETSPFTIPIKSLIKNGFLLPDPALTYTPDTRDIYTQNQVQSFDDPGYVHSLPRKRYFESKVPPSNSVINILERKDECEESVTKASEALLTFRKPSIERLLN